MTAARVRSLSLALGACVGAGVFVAGGASDTHDRYAALPAADDEGPFWLSQTGLYAHVARKQVAAGNLEYEPAYELWSDGAAKRRWLRLPAGTRIDARDMDHWQFPVGTRLWKEFSSAGRRVETRLIVRTGSGPNEYWMGAFVWNEDGSDAQFAPAGAADANGTEHDVPSAKTCHTCHNGEPGRVLGFSAVQQPDVDGALLSGGALPLPKFAPPGDSAAAAALGYLHANCGHCHNPRGSARPDTDLTLRLSLADERVEDTNLYRTAIGQPLRSYRGAGEHLRIARGDAAASGLWRRMLDRSRTGRMPPLGTEEPDVVGLERVKAFIDAL